jgi:hypothetical protein
LQPITPCFFGYVQQPVKDLRRRHSGCKILQDNLSQHLASWHGFNLRSVSAIPLQEHQSLDRRQVSKWGDFTAAKSYIGPVSVGRTSPLCDARMCGKGLRRIGAIPMAMP